MNSIPVCFSCAGDPLIGMIHPAHGSPELGVLMIVAGGPQYRIGGHRQLVLWSRKISEHGYPVFRFDFRGMGDSYGQFRDFEEVEDDVHHAIDRFFVEVPSLKQVVLWGECNASSAALFLAYKEPRIKGIVMLNPWVRTESGRATAVVKHYYLKRLTERSFWAKIIRFQFDVIGSVRSAAGMLKLAWQAPKQNGTRARDLATTSPSNRQQSLPDRMLGGLARFKGPVMLVMSGRDLIGREFDDLVKRSPNWQRELAAHHTVRHDLAFADHTFSTAVWRDQVVNWGIDWLRGISKQGAPALAVTLQRPRSTSSITEET